VRRHPRLRLAVAVLALLAAGGAGCGKKGPPVAPEKRLPAAPTGMSATVEADSIVVNWSIPRSRVDGTPLRDVALVRLHRRAEAEGEPAKSAMVSSGEVVGWDEIAYIKLDAPGPAVVAGNAVKWIDRRGLVLGRRYVYVATVVDSTGRWSAPSERLPVLYLAAPRPPPTLTAVPGEGEARLAWQPPAGLIDGSPPSSELTYVILRGTGAEGPLAAITGEPVGGTSFVDRGLDNETLYRYAVRAVRREGGTAAYSEPSAPATVTPVDRTAPAPPSNLVAIPSASAVRLAWNASASPDVASYGVYRATGEGPFVRIGTTSPLNTVFTDRAVTAGARYRYAVTALDTARAPNESARSNVAAISIP
jgi:predicted small lipoprotein YifL